MNDYGVKMQNPATFNCHAGRNLKIIGIGLLFLLIGNGCALDRSILFPPSEPSTGIPSVEEPVSIESPRKGPAEALYNEAKVSMAQGKNQQAELAIERALRIEPGNAYYWYTMGRIKYRQGAYEEAIQLCLKSKSLAGKNSKLVRANDKLIGLARKDSGNKAL